MSWLLFLVLLFWLLMVFAGGFILSLELKILMALGCDEFLVENFRLGISSQPEDLYRLDLTLLHRFGQWQSRLVVAIFVSCNTVSVDIEQRRYEVSGWTIATHTASYSEPMTSGEVSLADATCGYRHVDRPWQASYVYGNPLRSDLLIIPGLSPGFWQ